MLNRIEATATAGTAPPARHSLRFKATEVTSCAAGHGPCEWLLSFQAPPSQGRLQWISIHGATPSAIRWVQVRRRTQAVFEMDSLLDRSGHLSSAGEMLHAMASMDGHPGMRIDCRDTHPLDMHETAVALRLTGPNLGALAHIEVHAGLLDS